MIDIDSLGGGGEKIEKLFCICCRMGSQAAVCGSDSRMVVWASQVRARGCCDTVRHFPGAGRNRIEKENELFEGGSLKGHRGVWGQTMPEPGPGGSLAVTTALPTFFVDRGGVLPTLRLSTDFFSAHV